MDDIADSQMIHATCVAWHDRAVLIMGRSGQGKSALGLDLMALGCTLIADDQVIVTFQGDDMCASCPEATRGMIEARGIGILKADTLMMAPIRLVVDLDTQEDARLPHRHTIPLFGRDLPLIKRISGAHFASAILQLLKAGWSDL